jgi:hypothetical protein
MAEKLVITKDAAEQIYLWITSRGGVYVWESQDLSNPGLTYNTPALSSEGLPYTKPRWDCGNTPKLHITDLSEVFVAIDKEIKRFHVGVKRRYGLQFVLTDAASRKVRAAVANAGNGAYYTFDYTSQDAIIMAQVDKVLLREYVQRKQL